MGGRPLLDWVLGHLARFGVEEAVLNAHHLAEQIQAYAAQYPAMRLQVLVETPQILGTGGGLWNARQALAGASLILVCNGDILTDLDLARFRQAHGASGALASLALNQIQSSGMLLFDASMKLQGRINHATGKTRLAKGAGEGLREWGFSGFHLLQPEYFNQVQSPQFDIIEQYLDLADQGLLIQGVDCSQAWFWDIGLPHQLEQAALQLAQHGWLGLA